MELNADEVQGYVDIMTRLLNALKNYLVFKNGNDFGVEFNITQINAGRIIETEEIFESKIELLMESYSFVKFSKKKE